MGATAREQIFEQLGEAKGRDAEFQLTKKFVAALLRGNATLLGQSVKLTWPSGRPAYMSDQWLADYADDLDPR